VVSIQRVWRQYWSKIDAIQSLSRGKRARRLLSSEHKSSDAVAPADEGTMVGRYLQPGDQVYFGLYQFLAPEQSVSKPQTPRALLSFVFRCSCIQLAFASSRVLIGSMFASICCSGKAENLAEKGLAKFQRLDSPLRHRLEEAGGGTLKF
jgi:hypothetical protein